MGLIKCTECGAMISDQAKSCPKCGCPVEHDDQVEEIHNRPRRIGKWILVAVIAIIAIGGGIAYITLSKDNIIKQATHEEPMVKLTPEFCKAVRKYNCLFDFENGFASVRNGEKWGAINTEGKEVVPCIYDMVCLFHDDLAAVCKNDKWGYVNTKGELIIPCIYEYANDFSEGLASVRKNGKEGFINKKGEIAIPFKFEECGNFSEGLAYAGNKKGHYFINTDGNIKIHLPKGFYINRGSSNEGKPYPEFHNGECWINLENNKNYGCTINTKGEKITSSIESTDEKPTWEYEIFRNDNGLVGVKNVKTKKIVVPAKYRSIGESARGYDYIELHNGVVVATIAYKTIDNIRGRYSNNNENVEWDTDEEIIYGYIDMQGNETFTSEDYKLVNEKNNDYIQEETELKHENEIRSQQQLGLQGAWYSQQNNSRLYMYFDDNTIYTYISDRYSIENAYTYEDGIIHFGNNGTLYYDAENGTLQGANGKSFYKDESITSLEEMKEAARNYNQGYSSSSSYSYGSSDRDPYARDMRSLTEHTSEYRSGSWRGNPARLMFLQQAIISDYDDLISTASSLGDERRYNGFKQAREVQIYQFRNR